MNLTADQLVALAAAAGSGGDPATAAAVALAESEGNPAAVNVNQDQWSSRDRGLWQINDHWHSEVSDGCALDPACSARSAYVISNGWTDFHQWATFRSGAYLAHVQEVSTAAQQAPSERSLYGQTVVGQMLSSPWFQGQWEVTQGWGPTDYDGEPEGHGYQHWHAGVDIGLDCGTVITFPAGAGRATVRSLDNPDGYGTALVVLVDQGPAIVLGHLRQRLVDDGTQLTGGEEIAISNSTGNSTGCHLHFEVRPQDPKRPLGMAAYGTDVDPSGWLLTASGSPDAQLLAFNPGADIQKTISQAATTLIAGGQVLVGAAALLGGLVAAAYGMRGQGPGELARDTRTTVRRLNRKRRPPARPQPERGGEAAESRVRPDLQTGVRA